MCAKIAFLMKMAAASTFIFYTLKLGTHVEEWI